MDVFGADVTIKKPFDIDELIAAVDTLVAEQVEHLAAKWDFKKGRLLLRQLNSFCSEYTDAVIPELFCRVSIFGKAWKNLDLPVCVRRTGRHLRGNDMLIIIYKLWTETKYD